MGLGFLQADHPTQLVQHRSPTAGSRFITFEVDEVGPIVERLLAAGAMSTSRYVMSRGVSVI